MTYAAATRELKRVGCGHAEGEALAAMYADLLVMKHGGKAEKYYAYLQTASDVSTTGRELMKDRAKAWDALLA